MRLQTSILLQCSGYSHALVFVYSQHPKSCSTQPAHSFFLCSYQSSRSYRQLRALHYQIQLPEDMKPISYLTMQLWLLPWKIPQMLSYMCYAQYDMDTP